MSSLTACLIVFATTLFATTLFATRFGDACFAAESETVSIKKNGEDASPPLPTPSDVDPSQSEADKHEAAAIEFVKQHHPELVSLLQLLKAMKQAEYEAAIREINKVSKRLEALKPRDPESYSVELDAWKIQSKIDLLLARAVAQRQEVDADALRKLVKKQVDTQRRRLRHERTVLSDRQRQIKETLDKLESNEEERVDQQVASFMKRVRSKVDKNGKPKNESNKARDSELK